MDIDKNMVERMLLKGDKLKPHYDNFDYSQLDETQLFWLDKLSTYTKYRTRVVSYFNGTGVKSDMKVMFLDQHSMRIGQNLFYTLERERQKYLQAIEVHPMMALGASLAFFIRFALRTPIHRNLMRELGYSLVMGFGITYVYPYYKYQQYLAMVDQCYDIVTAEFEKRPQLLKKLNMSEDKNAAILKNFGLSNSNDNDIEDDMEGAQ